MNAQCHKESVTYSSTQILIRNLCSYLNNVEETTALQDGEMTAGTSPGVHLIF